MGQSIIQVDAFTSRPFGGNPAAVCVLPGPADPAWMQQVAAEMNLAETAFLHPTEDGYALRWFTPATEVDLCGHATLASAHVLWEDGRLPRDAQARFTTRSGLLTAERDGDWIAMNFPAFTPVPVEDATMRAALAAALGVQSPRFVGRVAYTLVELAAEADVRAVRPDFPALDAIDTSGVIVTAPADDPGFDFVSRFFAPRLGVNEDPVTGSAHSYLAPFWAERLGKQEMVGYQASRRGGVVRVRLQGDRVVIGGQAVTTLRGELAV